MANEPTYVDGGEDPGDKSDLLPRGPRHRRRRGAGRGRRRDRRPGRLASATHGCLTTTQEDARRSRATTSSTCSTTGAGTTATATCSRSTRRSSRARRSKMGQKIGVLGKEGGSGGWSHLHFEIKSRQPSGKWGTQEGYAFLWQAGARASSSPTVVAVARPHHLRPGRRPRRARRLASRGAGRARSARFDWTFTDGTTATGPRVETTYDRPGAYSEILKVTDARARFAYDFAVVQVLDPRPPRRPPADDPRRVCTDDRRPSGRPGHLQGADVPDDRRGRDLGLRRRHPGRSTVHSDGNVKQHAPDGYAVTIHRFAKPGDYLVRVDARTDRGWKATARLHVHRSIEQAPRRSPKALALARELPALTSRT